MATNPAIRALLDTQNVVNMFHKIKPVNVYLNNSLFRMTVFLLEIRSSSSKKGIKPTKITGAVINGGKPKLNIPAPARLKIKYFFFSRVPKNIGSLVKTKTINKLTNK